AAGHYEIELALFPLLECRVDDVLAVDEPDPDARDRLLEWNLREGQRGGRPGDREDVGVILLIGRQDEGDNLRLVAPPGGEEGPDGPIDAAARQHFLLGRFPFALEKTAGDAARRVSVFAVVNGQRQEVDSLAFVRCAA